MLKLVKRKGLYPFEYMDSFKKFSENKLPDRTKYYSTLKNGISEEDNLKGGVSNDDYLKWFISEEFC